MGIGYLPQDASIFRGLTVEGNIKAVLELSEKDPDKREQRLDYLLDEFSISHLRQSPAVALSGGERRRVEIARALAMSPKFLLLDEPLAGIDPIAVGEIRELISHLKEMNIDEDAYRSASVAVEKLEARIKKYKNRLQDKKRHRDGEHEPMFAQQYILNAEEDSGEDTPLIIAEMPSEISRLSVGEAVMRMDLADVPLMMFRNASNGELNVVYKRHDGHVGWIDPSRKMA
eukprot:gene14762-14891_t